MLIKVPPHRAVFFIYMAGHKEFGGNGYSPEVFRRYLRIHGLETKSDPGKQGGIVRKDGNPIGWFRGPFWRADENDPGISASDVRPIYTEPNPSLALPNTGSELELNVIGLEGELENVVDLDNPVHLTLLDHNHHFANGNGNPVEFVPEEGFDTLGDTEKQIGFSPELGRSCIELNFAPGHDGVYRNVQLVHALRKFARIAEENHTLVAPYSVIPHRALTQEDVNPHPYVTRIALKYMGWERVRHFSGTSFQTHTEMTSLPDALQAINRYQMITPILLAPTLAGPFMNGSVQPPLQEIYQDVPDRESDELKSKTYDQLDHTTYQSGRYLSRFFGSPSGGVMRNPVPEDTNIYWDMAEKLVASNESPTIGRVTGHHTDFRVRPDLGPHGTIEIAVMDTSGARIERLIAMQEMTRIIGWKLQLAAHFGITDKLGESYPALFGQTPSKETYETVHWNTMEVSKDGINAVIEGMDGKKYPINELWTQLLQFVQEPMEFPKLGVNYQGLPEPIMNELVRSYKNPDESFSQFSDENGITSVAGYYETGLGSISQWMLARYKHLREKGMDEKEAIMNCSVDLGKSFHAYIFTKTAQDVCNLYNQNN